MARAQAVLKSPQDTRAAGRRLGARLRAGDVLALVGPLGAGKTELVKGVALGLDVPEDEPVLSPTFVLAREYAGCLRLIHVDAYRLSGAGELMGLGLDEALGEGAVVAIEWADRVSQWLPAGAIHVELEHLGPHERRITITVPDSRTDMGQALFAGGK